MKKIIASGLILTSMAFFSACDSGDKGGGAEQSEAEAVQEEMLSKMANEGEDDIVESFYLPSAIQIGSIFQKSGLKYLQGLTNPVGNLNKYETKTSKILNFGAYSADLAYIVLNGQSQDATSYLKVVSDLSNEIGFGAIFESKDLMSRFEKNLGNRDSIINIMIDIQVRTDMFVDDNNLQDVTYIIFAGAWVEGMYLGVKASDSRSGHLVSGRLIEQMTILDNLVKALRSNKNQNEDVARLTKELTKLEKFFNKLEENKDSQKIASFRDYKVSPEHLAELSKTILELRASIING